jgi:hypothetical protein
VVNCDDADASTLTVNADGGFDFDDSRVFAYRAGGVLMMVAIDMDGGITLFRQAGRVELPAVGTVTGFWTVRADTAFVPEAIGENSNVVEGVDAGADIWVRRATRPSGATYLETLQANTPRDGYSRRVPETVLDTDGAVFNVAEFISMQTGMGFNVLSFPGTGAFQFSVTRP